MKMPETFRLPLQNGRKAPALYRVVVSLTRFVAETVLSGNAMPMPFSGSLRTIS
jgi:hypothetical protein